MDSMTLNDPELVRLLGGLHDAYEQALVADDVEVLGAFFWDSSHVVRYGVAEQLYGTDALRAYRQSNTLSFTERRIIRREISTFGPACACIMSEIEVLINGAPRLTRQSQTWVQLPEIGWRIVSAHVSRPLSPGPGDSSWGAYADLMARTLELPLAGAHRPGVIANLERAAAMAAPLLAFSLPDEAEPAPVFTA